MGKDGFRIVGFRFRKKKILTPEAKAKERPPHQKFQSIFSPQHESAKKQQPLFIPPETFGGSSLFDQDEAPDDLSVASAWDIATRYHEFKAKSSLKHLAPHLRKLSAQSIMDRAQQILGSVVHPLENRIAPWTEVPAEAQQIDLDLEETIDESPHLLSSNRELTAQDLWMNYSLPRKQPLVLSVDTSLSMTGEKLALTAVALAVVLLQFPEDPIGIIAFENEAKILKRPEERISIQELVERFLDVPAQGYTHLEAGMKAALKMLRTIGGAGQGRAYSTVLVTDGKYTAGRDPGYLGPRFPHLVVLKMGRERASLELCRELAKKGSGALKEVAELDSLPTVMYSVVKDLLRGQSHA